MIERRRREEAGPRRRAPAAPARPGLDSSTAVLALQRAAGNRAVARQIEMRGAGRGEPSGMPRLPELVERLTRISQSLTFRMDGARLACDPSPGIEADE